jgi:ribulose-5-phosphate 4-epimerase/fuculose-1-phosphate aldolase
MILRNHGLLAAGRTVAEAFHEIYFLERACQAQVQALAGGSAMRIPSVEVCRLTASQFDRDESAEIMDMAWNAALRLIDDSAFDYRS